MITLTQREKSIIYGSLLGDAHIHKRGNSYRLKITHGINQKKYVEWKHENLKRLCKTVQGPKNAIDKKGYETVTFYTSSGSWLKEIYDEFYIASPVQTVSSLTPLPPVPPLGYGKEQVQGLGKEARPILAGNQTASAQKVKYTKVISPDLVETLKNDFKGDPVLLAVFFMDDGSVRNDAYSGKLATQGFTKPENHLLAGYLKECGIDTNLVLNKEAKDQYYLSIPAKKDGFEALVSLIEPIVNEIPDMDYKLNKNRKKAYDLNQKKKTP